jgi:hypothetical protein
MKKQEIIEKVMEGALDKSETIAAYAPIHRERNTRILLWDIRKILEEVLPEDGKDIIKELRRGCILGEQAIAYCVDIDEYNKKAWIARREIVRKILENS